MKAEDLIRNKLSSIIQDDRIILESREKKSIEYIKDEQGQVIEQENVIGTIRISISVNDFAKMNRVVLEDDVTYPDNKLQAIITNDDIIVDSKPKKKGYTKYIQKWLDDGINF